jgi:hypothetical protein
VNTVRFAERWASRFRTWLTRPRLNFYFAVFALALLGSLIYLESIPGTLDRADRAKGRDYLVFHLAGYIVARGEAHRLYDQDYYYQVQQTFVEITDFVPRQPWVYPPTVALLFSPLGTLPYEQAVVIWQLIQGVLFAISGVLLYRLLRPEGPWRLTAVLGYVAFYPLLNAIWNGQLAPVILLALVAGESLRQAGRPFAAGLVWSLLALKPQFFIGLGLWLLFTFNLRMILGIAVGGLVQLAVVVATLGPDMLLVAYPSAGRVVSRWYGLQSWAPDHQHALAGVLIRFLGGTYQHWATAFQLVLAGMAGWGVWRLRRRAPHLEIAGVVIFQLLLIPYVLTYDLSFLLLPITVLLAHSREQPALLTPTVVLFGGAALAPLYAFIGFSLMPLALLAAMFLLVRLAGADSEMRLAAPEGSQP